MSDLQEGDIKVVRQRVMNTPDGLMWLTDDDLTGELSTALRELKGAEKELKTEPYPDPQTTKDAVEGVRVLLERILRSPEYGNGPQLSHGESE